MVLTRRKRKLEEERQEPESRVSKKTTTRKTRQPTPAEPPIEYTAATFKTPSNPQATFEGLPAELRLQIYDHLCDSTIIHVHRHIDKETRQSRFTWTPCRAPSPSSPLLCANPKWSGMCAEEDRCTYKMYAAPEPRGFWALRASNKHIRNEAQGFFLQRTVVSIQTNDLGVWLGHLAEHAPGQIDHLRRITIAGPYHHLYQINDDFSCLQDRIPNLQGVGFQCQDFALRWRRVSPGKVSFDREAWKTWPMLERMRSKFDASITIALEAMVWLKGPSRYNSTVDQQVAVRILREGEADKVGASWGHDDVKVEIDEPGRLAANKRNAKWRQWWNGKDMREFTM